MSLTALLESFCHIWLPWNIALAVFGVFLCFTGRFWQRNTSPLLRRVGYCCAIYLSIYPLFTTALAARFPQLATAMGALTPPSVGESALPALRAFNWPALLGAVWAVGTLACAAARILPRVRFRRWLAQNRRPLSERAAAILENVELQMDAMDELRHGKTLDERPRHRVGLTGRASTRSAAYVVEGLPGPMCVMDTASILGREKAGRECLLLDREDYDEETLDAIFRHELAHIVPSGLWLWGYEDVIAVLCWWNPAVWLLRRCLREETELYCDEYANRHRSKERRAAYARVLTEFATRKRAFLPGTAQMACGDKGMLRRRVKAVLEPPPRRRFLPLGILFLLIAILCATLFHLPGNAPLVTEGTFLSFLHAPGNHAQAFALSPAGLYGAEEAACVCEAGTIVSLSLTYAGEETLSEGQIRLAAALTERLGAPVTSGESGTVWQAVDESGARTEVWLMRGDGLTLTIF